MLGDCAAVTGEAGNNFPPAAQLAVQQMEGILLNIGRSHALDVSRGHHVAGRIAAMLKNLISCRNILQDRRFFLALGKFWEWRSYAALLRRL
jgi:hypothetical protein